MYVCNMNAICMYVYIINRWGVKNCIVIIICFQHTVYILSSFTWWSNSWSLPRSEKLEPKQCCVRRRHRRFPGRHPLSAPRPQIPPSVLFRWPLPGGKHWWAAGTGSEDKICPINTDSWRYFDVCFHQHRSRSCHDCSQCLDFDRLHCCYLTDYFRRLKVTGKSANYHFSLCPFDLMTRFSRLMWICWFSCWFYLE